MQSGEISLSNNISIKMLECNWMHCRFILKGATLPYANAIRRAIHCEVPTLAVSRIRYKEGNNVVFTDEFLAHRIGLIPLYCRNIADMCYPFEQCEGCCGSNGKDGCPRCRINFDIDITYRGTGYYVVTDKDIQVRPESLANECYSQHKKGDICTLTNYLCATKKKNEEEEYSDESSEGFSFGSSDNENEGSSDNENNSENENNVNSQVEDESDKCYTKPTGDGASIAQGYKNIDPDFISRRGINTTYISKSGIPICKLANGQSLKAEMIATKGCGKLHAKWTPASAVAMKPMVKIIIDPFLQEMVAKNDQDTIEWVQNLCPRKVFQIEKNEVGEQKIIVDNTYQECILCDDCVNTRYFKKRSDKVGDIEMVDKLVTVVQSDKEYYFDVESLGAIGAPEIVMMAINEIVHLINEINGSYTDVSGEC